jgi:hypothetical protein
MLKKNIIIIMPSMTTTYDDRLGNLSRCFPFLVVGIFLQCNFQSSFRRQPSSSLLKCPKNMDSVCLCVCGYCAIGEATLDAYVRSLVSPLDASFC